MTRSAVFVLCKDLFLRFSDDNMWAGKGCQSNQVQEVSSKVQVFSVRKAATQQRNTKKEIHTQ